MEKDLEEAVRLYKLAAANKNGIGASCTRTVKLLIETTRRQTPCVEWPLQMGTAMGSCASGRIR